MSNQGFNDFVVDTMKRRRRVLHLGRPASPGRAERRKAERQARRQRKKGRATHEE